MMTSIFQRSKTLISGHKKTSTLVLLVLAFAAYKAYAAYSAPDTTTKYVLANAEKGTIISSVSGTGQVSATNQVDLKSKVSGAVLSLPVAQGSDVSVGQVIARIDPTTAQKAVRDAEASLTSAKISLQKIQLPPDKLSLTQSQDTLDRANTAKENATGDLAKTYDDTFNSISNTFLDLPGVMTGLHDLLFTTSNQLGGATVNNIDYYANTAQLFDPRGASYGADANTKYQIALAKYNKNFQDYKALERSSDTQTTESLLAETYDTALALSDAVKSVNNLIQFFEDQMTQHSKTIPSYANTQLSTLNTYTSTMNTHLTDLLVKINTIKTDKNTIVDAGRIIAENTESLEKLKTGALPLDIETAQLSITQRENALLDAKQTLADYTIRAPFAGTLAKVSVKNSDDVSGGTIVATLLTKERTAQITLNELDATKIKVGQKATISFDAISGLSISGIVAEVDTIGVVSQGVVTYAVKIGFDTQDVRIKPGMSVSAAIITDVHQDVLTVPNSAVKSQGSAHYVQIFDAPLASSGDNKGLPSLVPPRQQQVDVGLSDDTATEITSGLKEGDQVVTKTTTGTASTAAKTTTAPSIIPTGGRGGGGFRGGGGGGD